VLYNIPNMSCKIYDMCNVMYVRDGIRHNRSQPMIKKESACLKVIQQQLLHLL